jgi:glyoxylase-like metal-dependent hydrolase (beta-lactamase superfamily II)
MAVPVAFAMRSPEPVHNDDREDAVDTITELGDEVFEIDTRMGGYSGITAGYLIRGDRPCLIETGTAMSAPIVVDSLAALGIGRKDLSTIVVTHIHLDHAGGVGDIAEAFPNAQVVVHERGARHLVDPTKLVASARRVFGSIMDTMFGDLKPTDAERVVALGDVGTIDLGGGRTLDAFHAPGHASHHVGLLDSQTGDLYTGDAAGVYIPETADVRPATPPPDFDLDLALASMDKMTQIQPRRLLFSHYGPVTAVDDVLGRSREELILWVELVRQARSAQLDLDHAVAMVAERTRSTKLASLGPEADAKWEALSSTAANVVGISRWLDSTDGPGSTSGDAATVHR